MKVLLVGNPNTGKTTLFNTLTNKTEHTGNWHGVTVEEKSGFFVYENNAVEVVDLPGLYSLNPLSGEEELAVKYIFSKPADLIICTIDNFTIKKNLYLVIELLLSGKSNIVLAVNSMGKTNKADLTKLAKELNVDVLPFNFANKKEVEALKKYIHNFSANKKIDIFSKVFSVSTQKKFNDISNKTQLKKYEIIKIIEKNNYFLKKTNKKNLFFNFFDKKQFNEEILIKEKILFIDNLLDEKQQPKTYGNNILDKILLNKFLALPCFFLIMLTIFYLTFFSLGAFLSDLFSSLVQVKLGGVCVNFLKSFCEIDWVIGLVENGIFGGALGLVAFLPQVALLFLFLSIMEDTGYFARVAFIFEDIFRHFGLSGKSVYTLLMGFGCSASAVLTARAQDKKNLRIKTAIITPYMSCSAKLPIYSVLGGAFFGAGNICVIVLLYLLGVFAALFVSLLLEKFLKTTNNAQFLMEFPPYRIPTIKKVLITTFQNMKMFIVKVFTIFVSMSIIIWCLSSFSFSLEYIPKAGGQSMLEGIGKLFAPVFMPLGFDSWGAVGALISGLVAKEVVVSSIAIFNNVGTSGLKESLLNPNSPVHYTGASALSYLGFCLLYPPCIATISVLKKEIGLKWTLVALGIQLLMAYAVAFLLYNTYLLAENMGLLNMTLILFGVFIVVIAFIHLFSSIKQKKVCKYCGKCKF